MLSFIQLFIDLGDHDFQIFGQTSFLFLFFAEVQPVEKNVVAHPGVVEEPGDMDDSGGVDGGFWADVFIVVIHPFMIHENILILLKGEC